MSGTKFSPYLFDSLPPYFQYRDNDKVGGKGTLERFLSIFQDELDPFPVEVEGLNHLLNPMEVPEKFLSELGAFYGFPANISPSSSLYRTLLRIAIPIYKKRGTIQGLEAVFNTVGAYITLSYNTTQTPKYDDPIVYDTDPIIKYDTVSSYCSDVTLDIIDPNEVFDGSDSRVLKALLDFLLPIHVKITQINYATTQGSPGE